MFCESQIQTPAMWGKIAGLTEQDIPTQRKCFWEEVQEFSSAVSQACKLDGLVDSNWVWEVLRSLNDDPIKLLEMEQMLADMYSLADFEHDVYSKACKEITLSNFSKFCMSTTTADLSVMDYAKKGISTHWVKVDYDGTDYYVIRSSIDQEVNAKVYPKGKILKGVNYFEPQLDKLLIDQ